MNLVARAPLSRSVTAIDRAVTILRHKRRVSTITAFAARIGGCDHG